MSTAKAEIIPAGEQSDDEWESYIRDASMGNTIVEHGKRWKEFYDYCHEHHAKQGGSHFRQFSEERFDLSKQTANMWVTIGSGAEELYGITGHFAPDYTAMYRFLGLDDKQKRKLLKSDEPISQKAIKALKDAAKPPPDDDPDPVDYDDGGETEFATEEEISERGWLNRAQMSAQYARYAPADTCPCTEEMRDAAEDVIAAWGAVLETIKRGLQR